MKKLNVSWDDVYDPTGYLFSFAKSLSLAVKNSPYKDLSEDIIATSGFAFRVWVSADLCPSETSIWDFSKQSKWILNGGLETINSLCLWQPESVLSNARNEVLPEIKASIDRGIPVIAWDIGVCEWGLITGYDDKEKKFSTLCINGSSDEVEYDTLGNREMPMLNVVIIKGNTGKSQDEIIKGTKALLKAHLMGEEWCDNAQGLDAYPRLIDMFEREDNSLANCWGMEYTLGTYGGLKWYAWKFFEKYNESELAPLYKTVYECWQKAFDLKNSTDLQAYNRKAIVDLLKTAYKAERTALDIL